jgi:hypothetical protein
MAPTIAIKYEDAAREAAPGRFVESRARKVIADICTLANTSGHILRLIKKCQTFGNGWLVAPFPPGQIGIEQGAPAPQPNQPEI